MHRLQSSVDNPHTLLSWRRDQHHGPSPLSNEKKMEIKLHSVRNIRNNQFHYFIKPCKSNTTNKITLNTLRHIKCIAVVISILFYDRIDTFRAYYVCFQRSYRWLLWDFRLCCSSYKGYRLLWKVCNKVVDNGWRAISDTTCLLFPQCGERMRVSYENTLFGSKVDVIYWAKFMA